MASELTVQTIKGPTSGGNANKILVPSGHTLTAPGHVIQNVSASDSTAGNTSSASAVQAWSGTSITPKFSNSLIKVQCQFYATHRDYYDGYIQLYKNGSAMSGKRIVIRNAGHTGSDFTSAASRASWYCPAWLWNFTEAAGSTSAITYSVYAWTQNGGHPTYWNSTDSNSQEDPTSTMILTEIAQ
jgi:hypothetical protein